VSFLIDSPGEWMPAEISAPMFDVYVNVKHLLSPLQGRECMKSSRPNLRHNLLRGIAKVIGGHNRQAAVCKDVLTLLHIGAF
jgi:hypothetical protein